jgi:hypothetical protein
LANIVIVAGDTGTGKSRSIKNLNPDETFIINVMNKPLSFEGSRAMYSKDKKNIHHTDRYSEIIQIIKGILEKKPEIKNIIIDDLGYSMTTEFFERSKESGYTKFAEMGMHMQQILDTCKNIERDDMNIALMFHEDDESSGGIKTKKKLKLIGQMLDDKYSPLGLVPVCLFTNVTFNDKGTAEYNFLTNRAMVDGVIIPAKSPEGMFELTVPNDLKFIFDKMNNYFN